MPIKPETFEIEKRNNEREYSEAYAYALKSEVETPDVTSLYSDYVTPLGIKISGMFDDAEKDRALIEEQWLDDLRQYKGEYTSEQLEKMHPKRSKAFLSLTRPKVQTVTSRQMDILFPANGDKNWGIEPTPIPDLDLMTLQSIMEQMVQAQAVVPSEDEIKRIINEEARDRCDAMSLEIEDQLSEIKYRGIIARVVKSGNLYGTGVLKGPLVKEQISKRWMPNGQGGWVTIEIKRMLPYCESVPVWDLYPDMTVSDPEDMRYIFQRHRMTRNKLYGLAKRSDFNQKAIEAYLVAYPEGDASFKNHEESLRTLSSKGEDAPTTPSRVTGKYDVKEFWGYLSSEDCIQAGIEVPEDQLGMEFAANVWVVGNVVIKAVLSPIEGVEFPYHFYYYEKDETCIFGHGIPFVMRDSQELFNASVRAMLDNAAISAGPIIEANMELLDAGEDPSDLYPFRVFTRGGIGAEATARALQVYKLPSYTAEYLNLAKFFFETADEVTLVPRYLHGDQTNLQGAGKTATGLSMLMGAANMPLKDQIKHFDDGITKPFVKSMYFWNMEFNPKQQIKGDFNVVCKGTTFLVAKEVMSDILIQFAQMTANDVDMLYINRDVLLREITKVLDIDDIGLIKNPDQVKLEEKRRLEADAQDKAFEKMMAMIKATSGGHMDNSPEGGMTPGIPRPQMENLSYEQMQAGEIPEVMP